MNQFTKLLAAFIIKLLLVGFLLAPDTTAAQRRSTSVNIKRDGKTTISIKNGFGNNFSIEYKGDITLSDDDTDIVAISPGGYMEIRKSAFGNRRRIFIEPENSGKLVKKYYVGGSQRSFDAEGKKWLAEILLEVVRTTTLGAEKRVNRLYKKGGYYQVLKEVDKIYSDYVQAKYIKLLLDKNLDEKGLIATLERVGDIDSDHHKADILKHNTNAFLSTKGTTASFIHAAGKIDSDHHTASVLKRALDSKSIPATRMNSLFEIARDIDSDHHKASVLLETLDTQTLTAENIKLLLKTSVTIDSDHHKATVLKKALAASDLPSDSQHTLLSAIGDMDSDHHMASVLSQVLQQRLDQASLAHLLGQVRSNLSSDMHRAAILRKAVRQEEMNAALDDFLSALTDMDSDHHKDEVFRQLSKKDFSDKELIQILEATKSINSDHHQAAVLISFASAVEGKSQGVRNAYMDASTEISSDAHLGRVLKAIR